MQAMGFVLEPSSLEAAVSLLTLSHGFTSLVGAVAMTLPATRQQDSQADLHAVAGGHAATLQGMLAGSLVQPAFGRSDSAQGGSQLAAPDEIAVSMQHFTYRPEMQVSGCAAASTQRPAGLSLSLHRAAKLQTTARIMCHGVLGSMAQTMALLQQAATDSTMHRVSGPAQSLDKLFKACVWLQGMHISHCALCKSSSIDSC